jgi:hypothetical protein
MVFYNECQRRFFARTLIQRDLDLDKNGNGNTYEKDRDRGSIKVGQKSWCCIRKQRRLCQLHWGIYVKKKQTFVQATDFRKRS